MLTARLLITAASASLVVAPCAMAVALETANDSFQQSGTVTALATSLMLQPAPASAAAPSARSTAEAPRSPLAVTTAAFGQVAARSDEKDGNGSVGISEVGGEIRLGYRLSDTVTLTLNTEATHYYFSFGSSPVFGTSRSRPFNDLNEFGIDPGVVVKFDDKWTGIFAGRFRWGGEPQNAFSSGFEGGGVAIATYKFSPTFTAGFGIGATSRINDSVLIIPFASFDWRVSDTVTVRSRRLGAEVVATLSESLTLSIGGEYDRRAFKLDDGSPFRDGAVRDREVSLDVTLAWKPMPNLTASVVGGASVYRSIRLDNASGDEIGTFDADPMPYIGARVEFKF